MPEYEDVPDVVVQRIQETDTYEAEYVQVVDNGQSAAGFELSSLLFVDESEGGLNQMTALANDGTTDGTLTQDVSNVSLSNGWDLDTRSYDQMGHLGERGLVLHTREHATLRDNPTQRTGRRRLRQ
jgi:hypothetical protein